MTNLIPASRLRLVLLIAALFFGCDAKSVETSVAPQPPVSEASPSIKATHTVELMVEGVSCASCTVTIRRKLKQLAGIVDIRSGTAKTHLLVDFDEQLVSPELILETVQAAGYEAEMLVTATPS